MGCRQLPYLYKAHARPDSPENINKILQDMWQELATAFNECVEQRDVVPTAPIVQNLIRNEITKIVQTIGGGFPPVNPTKNLCSMIGGILAQDAAIGGANFTPFSSSGTIARALNHSFPWPSNGYPWNPKVTREQAETANAMPVIGFNLAGYAVNGEDFLDFVIPPLATGPAVYGNNGNGPVLRVNEGIGLRLVTRVGGANATGTFPAWSALWLGDSRHYPMGSWGDGSLGTETYHPRLAGGGRYGVVTNSDEGEARYIPPACTFKKMYIKVITAALGGSTIVTVMKNGVATGLTQILATTAGAAQMFVITADVIYNGTTDSYALQVSVPGAGDTAAVFAYGFDILPTVLNSSWLPIGIHGIPGAAASYDHPFEGRWTSATENLRIFPFSRGGTMRASDCILYLNTALTGAREIDLTVRKNGAATPITWHLTSATPVGAVAASGADVTWLEDNWMTLESVLTNGGGTGGYIAGVTTLLR